MDFISYGENHLKMFTLVVSGIDSVAVVAGV